MNDEKPETPPAVQDGGECDLTKALQDIERGFENSWDEEEWLHAKGVLAKMLDQHNERYRRACEDRAEAANESMLLAVKVHNLALQADLWRDEFLRIKALSPGPEIEGLCDRAISDITQRFDLIQQRDKAEKQRDTLASQLAQAQRTIDETLSENTRLTDERNQLHEHVEHQRRHIERLEEERPHILDERSTLKQQLAQAQDEVKRLQENEQPLVRELVKTTKERDQLRAEKEELERDNRTMRTALAGVLNSASEPDKAKFAMMVPLEPIREARAALSKQQQADSR